ncbi:MAG: ORF6N domain-containing protein [Lutibacter sp.]|uniref:ORF6N domain-containing protein n=1 Tax=Lutibacter sp. TaxID=1925666 RepID=UPI0038580FB1
MKKEIAITNEVITNKIYFIRNQKVILDRDLALLYGVETKRLKEQVRRNINRFPNSFMFELTTEEYASLRSQYASLKQGRHSKYPPFVFTEHGILMLSSILNSDNAIKMSLQIIDTFVQLRKLATNYEELLTKIQQIELQYNNQFGEIYEVLQKLLENPKETKRTKIGDKKD